jgi:hypothetical protein
MELPIFFVALSIEPEQINLKKWSRQETRF